MKTTFLFIFVAFAAFGIIGSAFYQDSVMEKMQAERISENVRQSHIETADIKGYENVTSAKDGQFTSIVGYIDTKFLCRDTTQDQQENCTTAISDSESHMKVKLKVCSETLRTNCILYDPVPQVGNHRQNIYVLEHDGEIIDIDGGIPTKLRFTGKVSVINGHGRFVEPVERINIVY